MRIDSRQIDELRKINIIPAFLKQAYSSVLIEWGKTRVLCSATVAEEIPQWMKNEKKKGGWITGEYQLLPTSTQQRVKRERNGLSGRTQEVQRLIGRSLRGACNLEKLEGLTIYIDCDVIDADGGTRCASITGSMIALKKALSKLIDSGRIEPAVFVQHVAAVSVGVVNGTPVLDLCYIEDKNAEVDMNVVMSDDSRIIEVQGTAEGKSFTRNDLDIMLGLAEKGLKEIFQIQKKF
ncbi:MAG TPA: ribonuclease PH [Lentisphaeria bacterium]|nr:MAG: ribonuclease PH [Lentisphaerae bacterium GWF2_38_69]HBM14818.1 ribonuclease PH [Lentisphaeria bacterium]